MNLHILLVILALAFACRATEAARISIPALLNPATRMQELQRYLIASEPPQPTEDQASKAALFARSNNRLRIETLHSADHAPRYVVTWCESLAEHWSSDPRTEGLVPRVLTADEYAAGLIFSAEGDLLSKIDRRSRESVIADLEGTGELQVIEQHSGPSLAPSDHSDGATIDYLTVHPLGKEENSLVLVLNTHRPSHAAGNTWGFQANGRGGDGTYEIQLGPVKAPEGIEPKVTFQWDKVHRRWNGPTPGPQDHFRVIEIADLERALSDLLQGGGLHYPLLPSAHPDLPHYDGPSFKDEMAPPPAPRAYTYHSLADLSDAEMLTYFSKEHGATNFRRDRSDAAAAVPNFWELDPEAAAINYVRRNRPPEYENRYLLSLIHDGKAAPTEGDLTLAKYPWNYGGTSERYVYHFHCGRERSYLAEVYLAMDDCLPTSILSPRAFEAKKLDLTSQDARHLLQTVWWMHRIRSRCLTHDSDAPNMDLHPPGGRICFTAPGEEFRHDVTLLSRSYNFVGVGYFSGEYDFDAFGSTVAKLFESEAPSRVGAWVPPGELELMDHAARNHLLARDRTSSQELLAALNDEPPCPEVLRPIVVAAGWLGWTELSGALGTTAARLPPPSPDEHRLLELQAQVLAWLPQLDSSETTDYAYYQRHPRTFPTLPPLPVPGGGEPPNASPAPKIQPESPLPISRNSAQEPKLREFDKCYGELLEFEMPRAAREIADLRREIATARRQLAVRDDPDALMHWFREDWDQFAFVAARLAAIAPARAAELLRETENSAGRSEDKAAYQSAKELLAARKDVTHFSAETEESRKALLPILLDARESGPRRSEALHVLVPELEPKRYASEDLDRALLELLKKTPEPGDEVPSDLPLVGARRLGAKAWDALTHHVQESELQSPYLFQEDLAALLLVAQRDLPRYRATMADIVRPHLTESAGLLDDVLWSIWSLDLCEFKPDLERLATSGPADYEGKLAKEDLHELTPIMERYHLARQIAAVWNEEDLLTRTRLLIAFGVAHADRLTDGGPEAMTHFTTQLEEAWRGLSAEQRREGERLVHWCEENAYAKLDHPIERTSFDAVMQAIRKTIAANRLAVSGSGG